MKRIPIIGRQKAGQVGKSHGKRREYEPWQKALMCAVGQKCDWTDKVYLEPVLKFIKEVCGGII